MIGGSRIDTATHAHAAPESTNEIDMSHITLLN